MADKVMNILAKTTGGKSYKAHKYTLDHAEIPFIDYGENSIIWQKTAEYPILRKYKNLTSLSEKVANEPQILTYFLDGSRRVYKVDDIAYQLPGGRTTIYPVIAGQIGVGCCKREEKRLKKEKFIHEVVLSIPDIANADGKPGFYPATTEKLNKCQELRRLNVQFAAILPYSISHSKDTDKFEDKATACVQSRMIAREKEMVSDLVKEHKLNQNNYLIKDGSLEYAPTTEERKNKHKYQIFKNNYSFVLGISKNFNPEICLDINGKPNPGYIADLPLYNRTPVACFRNENVYKGIDMEFAVWYIRIHDMKYTRTAFDGIVKVEKMLTTKDELENGIDGELVDLLSAYIINERNPVCYGSDLRWANHIYPVFLTETYVKSMYLGTESFLHLF